MKVSHSISSLRKGFTIMETLLAIGIISMLLGIFLTLFLPAKDMVRSAIAREEAERITGILRSEMVTLRENERAGVSATVSTNNKFLTGFDKGFMWMQRTSRPATAIAIFSYRADTSKPPRVDGSYPSVKSNKHVPSAMNNLVSMACPVDEALHKDDLRRSVGAAFLVKMTQLEAKPNGDFRLADKPGKIVQATAPEAYMSSASEKNAWGGVLFFRADFYLMSPPDPARYKRISWDKMGKPIFSSNLSIRR